MKTNWNLIVFFGFTSIFQSGFGFHFLIDPEDMNVHQANGERMRLKRFAEPLVVEGDTAENPNTFIDTAQHSRVKRHVDIPHPVHMKPFDGGIVDEAIEEDAMQFGDDASNQMGSVLSEAETLLRRRREMKENPSLLDSITQFVNVNILNEKDSRMKSHLF